MVNEKSPLEIFESFFPPEDLPKETEGERTVEVWPYMKGYTDPLKVSDRAFYVSEGSTFITPDDPIEHPCRIVIPANHPPDGVFVVYGLFDSIASEMFYVGKTGNYIERMRQHCRVTRYHPKQIKPYGDFRLNDRKIAICANGAFVESVVLAVCCAENVATVIESSLIYYFRDTVLNIQVKSKSLEGIDYDRLA